MNDDIEIKLNDITFMAIDHGIHSIADGHEPLIPFVIIEKSGGERVLARFVTDRIEDGSEKSKRYIEENKAGIERYAIAWDGFVTIEGEKWNAILVESGDRFQEKGYLMCQRYAQKGLIKKKSEPFGNPALIGKPNSRIK
jgi:hypothetical protein